MSEKLCKATTATGEPCQVAARDGKDYCYFHDPEVEAERQAARIRGGRSRSKRAAVLPLDSPPIRANSCEAICDVLQLLINDVRVGRLDAKIGNSLGYLCSIQLRACESREQEFQLRYGHIVRELEAIPEPEREQTIGEMEPRERDRILRACRLNGLLRESLLKDRFGEQRPPAFQEEETE